MHAARFRSAHSRALACSVHPNTPPYGKHTWSSEAPVLNVFGFLVYSFLTSFSPWTPVSSPHHSLPFALPPFFFMLVSPLSPSFIIFKPVFSSPLRSPALFCPVLDPLHSLASILSFPLLHPRHPPPCSISISVANN